jgi:hypothetical protein
MAKPMANPAAFGLDSGPKQEGAQMTTMRPKPPLKPTHIRNPA